MAAVPFPTVLPLPIESDEGSHSNEYTKPVVPSEPEEASGLNYDGLG